MPNNTPPPDLLHHYTDRAGLTGIIESKALWATHIRHLNDESEIRYPRDLIRAVAERLRPEFGSDWASGVVCDAVAALANAETSPATFVASFCEDGDNLGQWRGYAAQGHGFAIGFNRERLWQIAQVHDYQLIRLIYVESEQEQQFETALRDTIPIVAGWAANRATAPPALQQLLSLGIGFTFATLTVKNPVFRDEKEWRLAHLIIPGLSDGQARTRRTPDREITYEEMGLVDKTTGETPFAEVVIGPIARSHTSVAEIRSLLDRNGLERVSIRTSLVPLRY